MFSFHIGFTGTREGLSNRQREALPAVIWHHINSMTVVDVTEKDIRFHHGDCLGADEEAHDSLLWCMPQVLKNLRIFIHPPKIDKNRAFCNEKPLPTYLSNGENAIHVLPAKDYLVRNHDIVDEANLLIACPRTEQEEQRSGTWATVRYARRNSKPIIILYPDGTTREENFGQPRKRPSLFS